MAEAAMFSLASKLLSTVASPAFQTAYEKGCSIWEARDDLDKLRRTIQTIQAVLLDAEKKQQRSAAVKDWIKRVRDVLYDADDLFDEVATDDVLRQQIKGEKLVKKVWASCSKLNQIVSRNSIANRVKAIRKSLLEISIDMEGFKFVESLYEQPISSLRKGQDPGSFVDSKNVFGRYKDKKAILEMLLDDQSNNDEQDVSVIAIVGIGGMGKTTLAQLVYNDERVQKNFDKMWFACISDTSDDKDVLGKICQSICKRNCGDFTVDQLQSEIRKSIKGSRKFLLVLDDVWDEDHARWQHRKSLLSSTVKGSKIIVTTRSLSVARVVGALKPHYLGGLSESESWDLFKRVAFSPEQEKDSRWTSLGREIVKKCANVPLAIRSVGSLLYTKTSIQEWESFKNEDLSKLEESGDYIMDTLKLSYEHLPSNLKHCFAYCSVFPKHFEFEEDKLIYLWIALGYIMPNHEMQMVEQAGHSYFMNLFRRSFFQQIHSVDTEIERYKMHDLIHDLAQHVASEENILINRPSNQFNKSARHVGVGCEMDDSWGILAQLFNSNRLRSLIFVVRIRDSHLLLALNQHSINSKYLRALSLSELGIENVSSSIGELKHLRYLDLSRNPFESLPDSLINLVNLLTLDIKGCSSLKALPDGLQKLINLRHLDMESCDELKHMPPGMGELTCLQYLSDFKVGKAAEGVKMSGLDVLAGLELRGGLNVRFIGQMDDWDGDERWQLPVSLEQLFILGYPGIRIPHWANGTANEPSFLPNLSHLQLDYCSKVKYLSPLRRLPNLRSLFLKGMRELEYIEEDEQSRCTSVAASINDASFFPLLEILQLKDLLKLKGWSRRKVGTGHHEAFLSFFPLLSQLGIEKCPKLESLPLCPRLWKLLVSFTDGGVTQQILSSWSNSNCLPSTTTPVSSLEDKAVSYCNGLINFPDKALTFLRSFTVEGCHSLQSLHLLASPHLKKILIRGCNGLMSVEIEALPSLESLDIINCEILKSMSIAHLNVLREFRIHRCSQELKLWISVDWDSLPNLYYLDLDCLPYIWELPYCLKDRQAQGQLHIMEQGC